MVEVVVAAVGLLFGAVTAWVSIPRPTVFRGIVFTAVTFAIALGVFVWADLPPLPWYTGLLLVFCAFLGRGAVAGLLWSRILPARAPYWKWAWWGLVSNRRLQLESLEQVNRRRHRAHRILLDRPRNGYEVHRSVADSSKGEPRP